MLKWTQTKRPTTPIELRPKRQIRRTPPPQKHRRNKNSNSSSSTTTNNNSNASKHMKMPTRTRTSTTLERSLHRKSLDANTQSAVKRVRAIEANKENMGIHFLRSPIGDTSLIALHDLSNGKSPKRPATPTRRRTVSPLSVKRNAYARTLPTFEAQTYTPTDEFEEYTLGRMSFKPRKSIDESLSSSKMGDETLDKMLDAIIESARKNPAKEATAAPTKEYDLEQSIHEMEVRTPPHLKRQRVVVRRRPRPKQEMIGLTLPNGIPSPETPKAKSIDEKIADDLANMETPKNVVFIVDSLPENFPKDMQQQHCSTPTLEQTHSIKRCLTFSPESDDDFSDAKRSSVASSNISEGSTSCASRAGPAKGSLDLAVFVENNRLNVHVIRCRDLQRPNGSSGAVNAYVKVALLPSDETTAENGFQRTAVHRHSSRPYFDHRFKFDLPTDEDPDLAKRVQLAVWHRDRNLKRSEFLGCMSFPLRSIIVAPVNGSYKLQSQSCLNNPTPAIPVTSNPVGSTHQQAQATAAASMTSAEKRAGAAARQKSVEEDVISIDSMTAANLNLIDANSNQPITLSKKAIHQRDADENLFLRFLELDPPNEVPASSTSATAGGSGGRRLSSAKPNIGRTPFTVTKKLSRTAERGFGFSIVWTHPPRVEKIEPGLSADKNGILPGDYVIFVDKHNVVTMPEADVLNLIRSQGSTLTMEIFRRSGSSASASTATAAAAAAAPVPTVRQTTASTVMMNGIGSKSRVTSAASNYTDGGMQVGSNIRPSTACSSSSTMEAAKRRLNLPQVTFSKESISPITDNRRRFLLQLISREQNFISALHFGMQRFVQPLNERKDLISPNDHRTLFQNIDELLRISEDILEQLMHDDQEPQLNFTSRVYLSKTTAICAAYKKYCNGIKRADCVLVNKSRQAGSEFVAFITEPQVPRKRPDLTMFIHRPLQHFREILKLMQMLATNCHVDSEEHKNFTSVINELQAAYREITVSSGLMEPLGEGRPLLTLQDLESRMVFTKCKPFTLAVQGRQWIFGGDLSRVEGRSVKPYWTLLFSDIIVFAKVSRDRVLFITEEPIPIANIVDSCFHMRKKTAEFRITVDPNGRLAESPTGYCAPDLTRTPKKNARRKSLILRAPSLELKAVWQNLLQRQIFLVNAALGSTPLSSPLDSPDVLNTLVPLSDIGMATASMASIKLSSMDSINLKNQQSQQHRFTNPAEQFEMLIDEKCRILNKTGTPRASALHLANWMKGQLDKQQEEARLAAAHSRENIRKEDEHLLYPEGDSEERITYWTRAQLEKRTKELNLAKETGALRARPSFAGKRLSGVEELSMDGYESEIKSQSHSTTSGSQITVRSSPVANVADKLSVCRHCHKNCQQQARSSSTSPPNLICNSLKVQHSQASPNRCCRLNGTSRSSVSSTSTSTVTGGEQQPTTKAEPHSFVQADEEPQEVIVAGVRVLDDGEREHLLNGHCSAEEGSHSPESPAAAAAPPPPPKKHATPPPKPNRHSIKDKSSRKSTPSKEHGLCNCECSPADFEGTAISPDEVTQETCKLVEAKATPQSTPTRSPQETPNAEADAEAVAACDPHRFCKCVCKDRKEDSEGDDDLSLMLIGLAQLTPTAKLLHAEQVAFVPSIAVVPPTPDAILSKTTTNVWDNCTSVITSTATKLLISNVPGQVIIENIPEDSADESPLDEEPPYRPMNSSTSLRRYGTLSSLEKLPSEDRPDDNRSSDGDNPPDELDDDNEPPPQEPETNGPDDDIAIVTKEIFTADSASQRAWATRAGSFVAGKMSFFEESRAFIDKYLGRWNQEHQSLTNNDDDQVDECTSGATSGEDVWGTPTSGGDNDDMHLNSENTQSSPTKSSTSLNDDDDTELMMDELLMAPPMTASTIRGLLPRRRLEPLFEEETESDEEKTQQESEELKKGETTTNGHVLRDSIGSSSDDATEDEEEDQEEDDQEEEKNDQEDGQKLNKEMAMKKQEQIDLVLKDLVGQQALKRFQQVPMSLPKMDAHVHEIDTTVSSSSSSSISTSTTPTVSVTAAATRLIQMTISSLMTTMTMTTTMTAMNSSTSTTTSNESNTITPKVPLAAAIRSVNINSCGTVVRKTKFSPPPPPPRRLMLTQTNLRNVQPGAAAPTPPAVQQQSGGTADTGSSVDAAVGNIHRRFTQINQRAVFNTRSSAGSTGPAAASRQSTIIETSLLGPADKRPVSTSSTTASTTMTQQPPPPPPPVKGEPVSPSTSAAATSVRNNSNNSSTSGSPTTVHHGSGLSPRLEMRLALNHDILGDEDLISYDPGPDLTTILGHDLSTFHRLTGRDLLTRTATNRVQPKEAVISFCQQRNSKMDTPTVNRRPRPVSVGGADCIGGGGGIAGAVPLRQQHLQPNRNTWSSSAFAAASDEVSSSVNDGSDASCRNTSSNSEESKLSDLELLARREKMYCMSQSKSGSLVRTTTTTMMQSLMRTRSTSSVASAAATTETDQQLRQPPPPAIAASSGSGRTRKLGRDETALTDGAKGNRLMNFLTRRNAEVPVSKNCSRTSLNESNPSSTPERGRRQKTLQQLSPRKDNDKPSLNRRLWKQITKRRRASSVSELVAS